VPFKDPEKQKAYQREWCRKRRRAFFDSQSCEWCGTIADLELHHRDPSQKVHHAIWSWAEGRRMAEISKCMVLCGTCHDRAHAEARRIEAELRNPCGTWQAYKRGCRCSACRNGNAEYLRELAARKRAA
jgi:hypothetical protein